MDYVARIADSQLEKYLKLFGAVPVEGPKWCGKTWAARNASESEFEVADPGGGFRNREIARLNPQTVLEGRHPHLIDEWQEVPTLWDAVRHEIDRVAKKGQFILTGSSTPDDTMTIHSGTGRFGRIRLETMSLLELGIAQQSISLDKLFHKTQSVNNGEFVGALTLPDLIAVVCKGGWPGLIGFSLDDAIDDLVVICRQNGGALT